MFLTLELDLQIEPYQIRFQVSVWNSNNSRYYSKAYASLGFQKLLVRSA